mmetsp:Transcript_101056/g.311637  ORF Transcript_101056/g.311637 Transcript_101056/m.311637 type:complete len:251 (-) Transcript_101056:30-782(-)
MWNSLPIASRSGLRDSDSPAPPSALATSAGPQRKSPAPMVAAVSTGAALPFVASAPASSEACRLAARSAGVTVDPDVGCCLLQPFSQRGRSPSSSLEASSPLDISSAFPLAASCAAACAPGVDGSIQPCNQRLGSPWASGSSLTLRSRRLMTASALSRRSHLFIGGSACPTSPWPSPCAAARDQFQRRSHCRPLTPSPLVSASASPPRGAGWAVDSGVLAAWVSSSGAGRASPAAWRSGSKWCDLATDGS